jgi:hypothetical protein
MGLARVGQKPSAIWVKSKSALTNVEVNTILYGIRAPPHEYS